MTRKDFTELFYYAGSEFGVDWNSANNLFFGTILNYGSVSYVENEIDYYKESSFEELDKSDKARFIASHWLESIGSDGMEIDCR